MIQKYVYNGDGQLLGRLPNEEANLTPENFRNALENSHQIIYQTPNGGYDRYNDDWDHCEIVEREEKGEAWTAPDQLEPEEA